MTDESYGFISSFFRFPLSSVSFLSSRVLLSWIVFEFGSQCRAVARRQSVKGKKRKKSVKAETMLSKQQQQQQKRFWDDAHFRFCFLYPVPSPSSFPHSINRRNVSAHTPTNKYDTGGRPLIARKPQNGAVSSPARPREKSGKTR